ncbi:MAG: hypothetical protein H0W30_18675 [Gemmatimonadaceae bacterium]|nr:hypothetical protein [Gemmatimonadaceae bacterium]
MATKLDKTIKREIEIDGQAYMITISPEGVKLTQKGFRKGQEVSWKEILGGGKSPQADSADSGDRASSDRGASGMGSRETGGNDFGGGLGGGFR